MSAAVQRLIGSLASDFFFSSPSNTPLNPEAAPETEAEQVLWDAQNEFLSAKTLAAQKKAYDKAINEGFSNFWNSLLPEECPLLYLPNQLVDGDKAVEHTKLQDEDFVNRHIDLQKLNDTSMVFPRTFVRDIQCIYLYNDIYIYIYKYICITIL